VDGQSRAPAQMDARRDTKGASIGLRAECFLFLKRLVDADRYGRQV
jgi:hypothetical protein